MSKEGLLKCGYKDVKLIGMGSMGNIFSAISFDGAKVALKQSKYHDSVIDEVDIMSRFRHPNMTIAQNLVTGCVEGVVIEMNLAKGDLFTKSKKDFKEYTIQQRLDNLFEVGCALLALHAGGIIHRDVKPENMLYDDNRAYLTDFGVVRYTSADGTFPVVKTEDLGFGRFERKIVKQNQRLDVYQFIASVYAVFANSGGSRSESEKIMRAILSLIGAKNIKSGFVGGEFEKEFGITPPIRFIPQEIREQFTDMVVGGLNDDNKWNMCDILQHPLFYKNGQPRSIILGGLVTDGPSYIEVEKSVGWPIINSVIEKIQRENGDEDCRVLFWAVDLAYRCIRLLNEGEVSLETLIRIAKHKDMNKIETGEIVSIVSHLKGRIYRQYIYEACVNGHQIKQAVKHILPYYEGYLRVDIPQWLSLNRDRDIDLPSKMILVKDVF